MYEGDIFFIYEICLKNKYGQAKPCIEFEVDKNDVHYDKRLYTYTLSLMNSFKNISLMDIQCQKFMNCLLCKG